MDVRLKYCPQFKDYYQIRSLYEPFIMFTQNKNFRSKVCNTDIYGFRFNNNVNLENFENIFDRSNHYKSDKAALIGSSTSFGIGVTEDKKTIASLLSHKTNYDFFNLGGKGFSGLQEIIVFQSVINKMKNLKKIIIVSGINDLYLFNSVKYQNFTGPFYYNQQYLDAIINKNIGISKKILKFIFKTIFPNEIIYFDRMTKKEILKYLLESNYRNSYKKNSKYFTKLTNLDDSISRNLTLWKYLSKGLGIEIHFFLQPFLDWCKEPSKEELEISEYLYFKRNKDQSVINLKNYYEDYKKKLIKFCNVTEIPFFDCNDFFRQNSNKSDWLFVDRIHLNDKGSDLISEYIKSKI